MDMPGILALSVQRKECVMKFSRYSKHLVSVLSILEEVEEK